MPHPTFPTFTTIRLTRSPHPGVTTLELARPDKRNALTALAFTELRAAVAALAGDRDTRAVVLRGSGPAFCAGADVGALADTQTLLSHPCPGRGRTALEAHIKAWQASFSALEALPVPVVAAVHGACVGAGVDLVTACDIRYAASDAAFCVKEVDLAITADLGTLQRLPAIVGAGVAADWSLTARSVSATEAAAAGLVTRIEPSREAVWAAAEATAAALATKSPLAVAGTKRTLLAARDDPSVPRGLAGVAALNAAILFSADLKEALTTATERRAPVYMSRL